MPRTILDQYMREEFGNEAFDTVFWFEKWPQNPPWRELTLEFEEKNEVE